MDRFLRKLFWFLLSISQFWVLCDYIVRWHSTYGKYTRTSRTRLHGLEWATAGIGLHVNADKTVYMCFNQRCNISTLNGSSLKLVDKFTYLGSSVSSNQRDINTRLVKVWTATDRLLVTWKSDLTNKMKRIIFSKWQLFQYCYMDALHGR